MTDSRIVVSIFWDSKKSLQSKKRPSSAVLNNKVQSEVPGNSEVSVPRKPAEFSLEKTSNMIQGL